MLRAFWFFCWWWRHHVPPPPLEILEAITMVTTHRLVLSHLVTKAAATKAGDLLHTTLHPSKATRHLLMPIRRHQAVALRLLTSIHHLPMPIHLHHHVGTPRHLMDIHHLHTGTHHPQEATSHLLTGIHHPLTVTLHQLSISHLHIASALPKGRRPPAISLLRLRLFMATPRLLTDTRHPPVVILRHLTLIRHLPVVTLPRLMGIRHHLITTRRHLKATHHPLEAILPHPAVIHHHLTATHRLHTGMHPLLVLSTLPKGRRRATTSLPRLHHLTPTRRPLPAVHHQLTRTPRPPVATLHLTDNRRLLSMLCHVSSHHHHHPAHKPRLYRSRSPSRSRI
ncbi:hypothetical protein NMG60_11034115 [Bertholletia excelsa]